MEDDTITPQAKIHNLKSKPSNIYQGSEIKPCPVCNSVERFFDNQRAEVSCAKCGLVLEDNIIDPGQEWRAFDSVQKLKRARTGAPSTFTISDKGLTTTIDWRNKDSNGRNIPDKNKAQIYRLRKWNKRIRVSNAGERNLAFALSELDRESSSLQLPRIVREDAAIIYRNAAKSNLIRGRSIESVVASSIYTACRRCNIPRTLDEISEISNVSKKQIGKNYRFLCRELKIKLKPTSPIDYIPRFASRLRLSGEVEAKAIEILKKANDKGLNSGKGPTGLAAAALYISAVLLGERKTQGDIAKITNVTEVTIRNRYKELSQELNLSASLV